MIMEILEGKSVAEKIRQDFELRLNNLKIKPNIAVLGIRGDDASDVYIRNIKRNCEKYQIGFNLILADTNEEFKENFEKIKQDEKITGIMFQEPLPKELKNLIDEIPSRKDIEGIGINNMGKVFLGKKDALIPCTSKAVVETIDYYGINLEGRKVVIVGRSDIVGKPLIPQLLGKNATVTVCHSKTKDLTEELKKADVIIMAIGEANFLKQEMIKKDAILIDVGINFKDGKIVGDVDFEDVENYAKAATPVPGGIGVVTNALLIDNIIKSTEFITKNLLSEQKDEKNCEKTKMTQKDDF